MALVPTSLVECVYVLSDESHTTSIPGRELVEREVSAIRDCLSGGTSAHGIETPNESWVTLKSLRGGDFFDAMIFPESVSVAESFNP